MLAALRLLIGEFPGALENRPQLFVVRDDEREGRLVVGRALDVAERMLEDIGYGRENE